MRNFDSINRSYFVARENFHNEIPEYFNFAFDVLDDWAAHRNKTAVLAVSANGDEISEISYAELSAQSSRFANALLSLGLSKGDFACVVIGRIPAWYDVLFGCMKAGVVSMPGTNLLTGKDIAYRVNHASAKAVIVTAEHCDKIDAIRNECPSLEHFIVVGGKQSGWQSFDTLCSANSDKFNVDEIGPTRSDTLMMAYFTSGTTAHPKMVPRDYAYALAHAATGLFWMNLDNNDIHWTLTDTGWAKAAWGMLFPPLLLGATTVLYNGAAGFDTDLHLKLISKLKVTTFCAPPTVYRLFAQQDLSGYDLSSLKRSIGAGEPLNPEVIRIWQSASGTIVADGYGQTETVNIVANYPDMEVRFGSMGKPVPGFDVDIVDDEGHRLPDNQIGHIAVHVADGLPPGLFKGYYTGGELNTESFRHGWYYTGDTATRDADGYIWFVGRADDLISSAGYRISPFEVESALIEHPAIAESAVIGAPDVTRGQIVKAFIILAAGHEPSDTLAADIQEFCKQQTAPYKYPRIIRFVDSLPKTISGKIRRVELRNDNAAS
jgi:acetyl-CoA synthetase